MAGGSGLLSSMASGALWGIRMFLVGGGRAGVVEGPSPGLWPRQARVDAGSGGDAFPGLAAGSRISYRGQFG